MPVPLLKPEVPAEVLSDLKKGVTPEAVELAADSEEWSICGWGEAGHLVFSKRCFGFSVTMGEHRTGVAESYNFSN